MPEDFASQIATLRVSLAAEERQWEIGTWSSGSGEGLASMFEVRTLQVARAWLTPDREEGRALMQQVSDDPNDSGARLRPHIDAWLASPTYGSGEVPMMFQSPRRFPVLVAVSFVWCVRTAFAGGAALDLAGDASDAVVVNDIGQHTVITVDAAGVRGGPSVLAPDTTWRLDADRRVPGRAVLAAIADLGKADPAPRLSLRLGDPRPQLDVPQISVVPGIELVVPDENGMPLVAIDAGGSWTLMRLSMDRETVLYELRRRLRATASKRVVVEVAPDRPWQDTLELVVVARQAGAAAIVLYDPARPLPSPAAPPPPPSVGGVPRRFHHSELEVVSQVPIDVPVELRPTTQVRCLSTVTIDPTGVPTEVVVEACPEALHGPVRASMMQWRWKSPVYDGAAVAGITMIGVVIQP